jgi:hypothetical protein
MTQPGPSTRRRRLPYHTDADMLELEARGGIHAGLLGSNKSAWSDALDGIHGGVHTPEQDIRGWTAQQPFDHVDCPVTHGCVLCWRPVDPDHIRDHKCKVAIFLEAA